jgi:hypothetical protein
MKKKLKSLSAGISRKQFLALNPSKQKKYLKQYPQSSHRFLLEEQMQKKAANDTPPEQPKAANDEPVKKRAFSRFMTKGQYALLSDEDKAKYLEQFPGSTHKVRPPRVKARPSRMVFDHDDLTDEEADDFHRQLMEEIDSLNTENRASINRESIGAMNDISTDDLREGAEDLKNNAEEVADDVAKRFANRPKLMARGLQGLRKLWGGQEELTPKEKRQTADLATQATKYAIIGLGVVALAVAASPAAFVIAHVLMEQYGRDFLAKRDRSKDDRHDKLSDENSKLREENSTMKAAERDRQAQIKARQKALIEEAKRRKEEEEERQEEIEEKQQELSDKPDDQEQDVEVDDTNEKEDDQEEQEEPEEKEEPRAKGKPDLRVVAATHPQNEVEYTHEDDQNTLTEFIRHLGAYLETTTADDLRNHARIAFGDKANHLVSMSGNGEFRSIEELAMAAGGQIEGNFVVTASARYEYNENTGRYRNAAD